jgi:hypothetical protein
MRRASGEFGRAAIASGKRQAHMERVRSVKIISGWAPKAASMRFAINSYNDGPPAAGQPPLGPFFELETSSPALRLAPAQSYTHAHRTFHFVGPEAELDRIARATIKVGLDELTNTFPTTRSAR